MITAATPRQCALLALMLTLFSTGTGAAVPAPVIHWTFDDAGGRTAVDAAGRSGDRIEGSHRQVAGVAGSAMVFDGYTTALVRQADASPDLSSGFTLAGWVAIAAYPWAAVPIVDQADEELRGFRFEVGPRGSLAASVGTDGRVLVAESNDYLLPHRRWSHVAATYDPASGIALYLDGKRVASAPQPPASDFGGRVPTGRLTQARDLDVIVGAVRQPVRPVAYHRYKGTRPTWMSLDGLLDELSVFDAPLPASQIRTLAGQYRPPAPELAVRVMPSGPPGPGRFGAYETTLAYYPEWDALSRVDADADIVVRFDRSPARVVFWRGLQYSPAWVTGNGLWMADQSVEGYDDDYTWEHMNDKHNRYTQVRVLRESDARVVVHWRYAPVNVDNELMNVGRRDEMGAWIDEYYTFYPDVVGVRRMAWPEGTLGSPVQFQESIPLAHPGQTQGDVVRARYATVGNLAGETQALEYVENPADSKKTFPDDLVIQMHHFHSTEQPFIVFEPGNRMGYLRDLDERSLARPGSSSHWPVARIWSDGRTAQAPDRATSFLGFPISEPVIHTDPGGRCRINSLYGMTDRPFDELVLLARSWAQAPAVSVDGDGYASAGFDLSQRAYRFTRNGDGDDLLLEFESSDTSPLFNVPILVEGWGSAAVELQIDGMKIELGPYFRYGYEYAIDSTDLVVWIAHMATKKTRIRLARIEATD